MKVELERTYVNDVQGLVDGGLGVEREASVNLGGDLAGDDLEDLLAELDQEAVEGIVDLDVDALALAGLLGGGNGLVNELGVLGLLGGSEDQGRVGGGILGLVFANGSKVTGVADDNLERGNQWSVFQFDTHLSDARPRSNCHGNMPQSVTRKPADQAA